MATEATGVVDALAALLCGWRVSCPGVEAAVSSHDMGADVCGRADVVVRVGGRLRLVAIVRQGDDTMGFLSQTRKAYRSAGVPLVWDIDPDERTVQCYPLGGRYWSVGESEELTGGDALPGFRVPVARLFE